MKEIEILKNQVVIMTALLSLSDIQNDTIKKLEEQIMITKARIKALS